MASVIGATRRLILAPSLADVTFSKRGFPPAPEPATTHLEAIPQSVVCGFEWGIESRSQWELQRRLDMIAPDLRGFAYEGATMAYTIRDALPGRGGRTRTLLLGPGRPHIFLAYIGIGFAMARLPRPLWKKIMPALPGPAYYPPMTWLAVDGYGFDLAFFDVERWVHRQRRPDPYAWEGDAEYFPRAVDQGIGRALWFVCGAQVAAVGAAVRRFAADRQADLWSGVGLAAAFAGGCTPADLAGLRAEAGGFQAELAQGAVFAIKARDYAGFVPEHGTAAAAALIGMSVPAAVALADDTAVTDEKLGGPPAYERWRRGIQARFAVAGGRPRP